MYFIHFQTFCRCFQVRQVIEVEIDDDQNNLTKRCKTIEDNRKINTGGNNGAVSMV